MVHSLLGLFSSKIRDIVVQFIVVKSCHENVGPRRTSSLNVESNPDIDSAFWRWVREIMFHRLPAISNARQNGSVLYTIRSVGRPARDCSGSSGCAMSRTSRFFRGCAGGRRSGRLLARSGEHARLVDTHANTPLRIFAFLVPNLSFVSRNFTLSFCCALHCPPWRKCTKNDLSHRATSWTSFPW